MKYFRDSETIKLPNLPPSVELLSSHSNRARKGELFFSFITSIIKNLMCACIHAKLFQSCPTLCDPMDCSLLGSSVHGIL